MIEFVYFSEKEDFFLHLENKFKDLKVITPSPAKADAFRSRFSERQDFDIITISKFTADLIKKSSPDEMAQNLKRKSEILLIFGVLRSKYFENLSFEVFWQCYEIFSDLRSFSLDSEILNQVVLELPEESQAVILLFDQLMKSMNILDEHAAYSYISQIIKEGNNQRIEDKTIIFWGFSHLNGQQIDLIKSLSLRNHILIPLPVHLKEKIKKGDWISWVADHTTTETHLGYKELNPKVIKRRINSREIAKNLKEILREDDQILMGISKIEKDHLFLIPSSEINFKIRVEVFNQEISRVKDLIQNFCFKEKKSILELFDYLKNQKTSDYKELKVIQLFNQAISNVNELTDEIIYLDNFFIKLLTSVVTLDQPRLFYSPLSKHKLSKDLIDMSSIDTLNPARRVILCVDDRFGPITNLSRSQYSESLQKLLSTIGPIKRPELDLEFKIWDLHSLMTHSKVELLITEESLKHDLTWKKIFQKVEFINEDIEIETKNEKKTLDYFESLTKEAFSGKLSSTRIQSYIDCPRKFYFNYIDKKSPFLKFEHSINPKISGEIVHKVIEEYFETSLEIDVFKLSLKVMNSFLVDSKISLEEKDFHEAFYQILHRAKNGIEFLDNLSEILHKQITWQMETSFDVEVKEKLSGKIDCYGVTDDLLILLDFKSSVVPTFSEIENFENIQIWTYLIALKAMGIQIKNLKLIFGFVSLDNPENSKIFTTDEDLSNFFKNQKEIKIKLYPGDVADLDLLAEEKLSSYIFQIKNESVFPPKPRKDVICQFCELSISCAKRSLL